MALYLRSLLRPSYFSFNKSIMAKSPQSPPSQLLLPTHAISTLSPRFRHLVRKSLTRISHCRHLLAHTGRNLRQLTAIQKNPDTSLSLRSFLPNLSFFHCSFLLATDNPRFAKYSSRVFATLSGVYFPNFWLSSPQWIRYRTSIYGQSFARPHHFYSLYHYLFPAPTPTFLPSFHLLFCDTTSDSLSWGNLFLYLRRNLRLNRLYFPIFCQFRQKTSKCCKKYNIIGYTRYFCL